MLTLSRECLSKPSLFKGISPEVREIVTLIVDVSDDIVRPHFHPDTQLRTVSNDGHATDIVTEVDEKCGRIFVEKAIALGFQDSFSEDPKPLPLRERCRDKRLWMFDPIDGTAEFTKRSFEVVGTHAAFLEKQPDNKYLTIAGIIYVPFTKELWCSDISGELFHFIGDRELPFVRPELSPILQGYFRGCDPEIELNDVYSEVSAKMQLAGMRCVSGGSVGVSVSDLLNGNLDLIILPRDNSKQWDLAMAVPMIKNLGGFICDIDGNDFDNFNRDDPLNRRGYVMSLNCPRDIVLEVLGKHPQLVKQISGKK